MAVAYLADSLTDYRDPTVVRAKVGGGNIMVCTRMYMSGTYTVLASWSASTGEGLIPAGILGLSRIKKLIVLTPPGAVMEATTITTTPVITARGTAALRTTTGFFAEYNDTVQNPTLGYAGGIYLSEGVVSGGATGLTSSWNQVDAATNIGTSPAGIAFDILAFGV